MKLSTHYYVLSLSERSNRLYEAFRGNLIDIENTWFPIESTTGPLEPALNDVQLRTLLQRVDHHFGQYYKQDPLGMVLAGTKRNQSAFTLLTAHSEVIIGKAEGEHSTTGANDLGEIVWPIVKAVMASAGEKVVRQLEAASRASNIAIGIEAVTKSVDSGIGATLLVEEHLQVKPEASSSLFDDWDNVVDAVVDKVLALRGNVIFVEDGVLQKFQRIALILHI